MNAPLTEEYGVLFERFSQALAGLNEEDPKLGDEAWDDIMAWAREEVDEIVATMHKASGFERTQDRDEKITAFEMREEMRWAYQADTLPANYERDSVEAFELGCLLPEWVLLDAVTFGASWDKRRAAIDRRLEGEATRATVPRRALPTPEVY